MYQHTARRAHGSMIITDPSGPVTQKDTVQCCHCDCHYEVNPGSGITRGFCMSCMAPTCGAPACCACAPFEKKLDQLERGEITSLD